MTPKLSPAQTAALRQFAEAPADRIQRVPPRQAAALVRAGYLIADPDGSGFALTSVGQAAVTALTDGLHACAPDRPKGKLGAILRLLQRDQGVSLSEIMEVTGWQAHSVRGALAGSLKKGRGIAVSSEKIDGRRVYRAQGAAS